MNEYFVRYKEGDKTVSRLEYAKSVDSLRKKYTNSLLKIIEIEPIKQ
jgi:hypothetical protein